MSAHPEQIRIQDVALDRRDGRELTMPLREIELDDDSEAIIAEQIASGRYTTPAAVLKAGLEALDRDLLEDDLWLARLKEAAQVGFDQIERGEYVTLNSEQDIHELMDGILAEVMKARHEGAADT